MLRAVNIARDNLISLGTCIGKFSKKGKFKLHVTALTYLAPYAMVTHSAHHSHHDTLHQPVLKSAHHERTLM